ncbi:MAG: response regulator [Leptolyngbyaceae cyanobacterium]
MYIEDEELRTLYRDASKDHLDTLEAGFLYLEKHPEDTQKLKELLRATHSLKGDSRMLGVQDAETLTHQLEDLLTSVEQGQREITSTFCDCLYQGVDAIRQIAHEAVTGQTSDVSVFHVLAQLMSAGDSSSAEPHHSPANNDALKEQTQTDPILTLPAVETLETAASAPVSLDPAPPAEDADSAPSSDPYEIETIRVEATKLDTLMTQAGELAVTKRRITRRTDDLDKILLFWEDWGRDCLINRLTLDDQQISQEGESLSALQSLQQSTEDHLEQLGNLLKQLRANASEDSNQLENLSDDLESNILKLRQLPLSSLFSLFPRMVRDMAKHQGKTINLVVEGGETQADKRILEEMKAPLTHLIRNAIDHGIEAPSERIAMGKPATATISLKAHQRGSRIDIEVVDDGRGLSLESIKRTALRRGLYNEADLEKMSVQQIQRLIFTPGFSTRTNVTEISGRGVGLDVVRVNVERLKGDIQVDSSPGQGCTFRFTLSTSLATASAVIVAVNQTSYAIPIEFVDVMMRVDRQDIFSLEGQPTITFQEQPLSIVWLSDLLDMPVSVAAQPIPRIQQSIRCVVLKVGLERLGIFVDELIDQQDIVLKPHSQLLKRVRNISGATILGSGEVCMVLSPQDLIRSAGGQEMEPLLVDWEPSHVQSKVLLVEDSIPIRTQVRRILEGVGYQVTTAVDGLDGLDKLQQEGPFDAVVSDVEMPNLDGLGLTTQIRENTKYENLPIVLVTTLAQDEDKQRGHDAGASAYITKGDFDQSLLIDTLRRLI